MLGLARGESSFGDVARAEAGRRNAAGHGPRPAERRHRPSRAGPAGADGAWRSGPARAGAAQPADQRPPRDARQRRVADDQGQPRSTARARSAFRSSTPARASPKSCCPRSSSPSSPPRAPPARRSQGHGPGPGDLQRNRRAPQGTHRSADSVVGKGNDVQHLSAASQGASAKAA